MFTKSMMLESRVQSPGMPTRRDLTNTIPVRILTDNSDNWALSTSDESCNIKKTCLGRCCMPSVVEFSTGTTYDGEVNVLVEKKSSKISRSADRCNKYNLRCFKMKNNRKLFPSRLHALKRTARNPPFYQSVTLAPRLSLTLFLNYIHYLGSKCSVRRRLNASMTYNYLVKTICSRLALSSHRACRSLMSQRISKFEASSAVLSVVPVA